MNAYVIPDMPGLQESQTITVVDFRAYYIWVSRHWMPEKGEQFFPHYLTTTISVLDRVADQWVSYSSWYFSDSCDVRVSNTVTFDEREGREKHRSLGNGEIIRFTVKPLTNDDHD